MTENNKLYKALNQLQFTGKVNDDKLKTLEKEIFTKENLQALIDNKDTITVNGISFQFLDTTLNDFLENKKTIKKILHGNIFLAKNSLDIIMGTIFKNKKQSENLTVTPVTENGFAIQCIDNKHFITVKIKEGVNDKKEEQEKIFDSLEDGRQLNNCCGIHALEGVLIAEALTEKGKNIKEFKQEHKKLTETSLDDLIEQRKILFKMEILDALILQNDKSHLSSFTITPEGNVLPNDNAKETQDEKRERIEKSLSLEALYKLYFEEFQARCAALQVVKKELEPVVKQTEAQESVRRVVIEEPKKEENDKKFDLPSEPKKESEIVNTQEVIEGRQECDTPSKEEPNIITATQTSAVSSTSTNKTPRYKVLERTGAEEKDAGFETYGIDNKPIDIDDESVKLYNKFLDQVLEEFKKEGKIVNIDLIKEKVEEKLFACFSIRNGGGEIISENNYSDKDKENIALAKEDYKYTAEHSELIQNRFNTIEEALKEYNERLACANKEVHERILKEQEKETATASVKM